MLLVAWWAWNYTTWVTNKLDPDSSIVRLLLIGIMLATLLMAVAIPDAFGSEGLLFACSYVAIQVGRHAFLTFASARPGTIERKRSSHVLVWLSAAGVFWIAGAFVEDEARAIVWLVALAIDYLGPVALYRVPGWKQLDPEAWDVEHCTLRRALPAFRDHRSRGVDRDHRADDSQARARRGAGRGHLPWRFSGRLPSGGCTSSTSRTSQLRRLELAEGTTLLARDGYTYLHVVLVRGHYRVGGRRRARHRTSDGRSAGARGRGRDRRAGDLLARARALPPAHGRHGFVEAARGRARLRGGRWAGLGFSRASRSPACSWPCSSE